MSKTANNPNGKNGMTSTSVIGLGDLNRMKLYAMSTLEGTGHEEDRRRLKEISDARIESWPNTVQALRKKKEAKRFENFKKDELERRDIEQDEAQYQSGQKRILLDRVKKQIFDRVDRVKAFHSKILVSDAINERELQLQIQKAKTDYHKQKDGWHHEELLAKCHEYDIAEAAKKKLFDEKRKLTQKVLHKQHEDFKMKHITVLQEEILEGE